jgi:hypothetical protein
MHLPVFHINSDILNSELQQCFDAGPFTGLVAAQQPFAPLAMHSQGKHPTYPCV